MADITESFCDVLIIGSGPAGVAAASTLLQNGVSVCLVGGGRDFKNPEIQNLYLESEFNENLHESLRENRVRGLGGTSAKWGGRLVEFSDFDFQKKNSVLGAFWPITKSDLIPYYRKSLEFFGIGEPKENLTMHDASAEEIAVNLNLNLDDMLNFAISNVKIDSPEIWTEIGNVYHNKSAFLKKFQNFHPYEDWHLTKLDLNQSDQKSIKSVVIQNLLGERKILSSKFIILACGAVENTRILQILARENSKVFGKNQYLIGKSYTSHAFFSIPKIYKPDNFFWDFRKIANGLLKNRVTFTHKFEDEERSVGIFFAYPPLTGPNLNLSRLRNFYFKYGFRSLFNRELLTRNLRKLLLISQKNRTIPQDSRINSSGKQCLHVQFEIFGSLESQIELGDNIDTFKNLLPNAKLVFSENDKRCIRDIYYGLHKCFHMFETSKEHLRLIEKDILERPNSHAHQIGGTIMGSDESNSVVNGTGKVHKIENLYVAGSSIFTTAGEANPTHTIVALSIRTSEFLVDLLKSSRA
jgi:hypothetical protein